MSKRSHVKTTGTGGSTVCNHRWQRCGTTGGTKLGRATILERCAKCQEEVERLATRAECAKLREERRREYARSREFHRAWYPAQRLLARYGRMADQDSKLKLSDALGRLMARFPGLVRHVRVDDDYFTCSDLWFIMHKCEDESLGREYWGTSVVFVSQCAPDPPVVFFCYPHHMRGLLTVAQEIDSLASKLNTWMPSIPYKVGDVVTFKGNAIRCVEAGVDEET